MSRVMDDEILDKPGEWEARITIYRNGRRVATCDTTGHESFDGLAYWVGQGLSTREVDMHVPRPRKSTDRTNRSEETR